MKNSFLCASTWKGYKNKYIWDFNKLAGLYHVQHNGCLHVRLAKCQHMQYNHLPTLTLTLGFGIVILIGFLNYVKILYINFGNTKPLEE